MGMYGKGDIRDFIFIFKNGPRKMSAKYGVFKKCVV